MQFDSSIKDQSAAAFKEGRDNTFFKIYMW